MDPIERAVRISVLRGVGFVMLGVVSAMIGLSFDPPLALKFGGLCMTALAAALALRGWQAPSTPYRQTEAWLILEEPKPDAPPDRLQAVFSARRREIYWRLGLASAAAALLLLGGAALAIALTPGAA